METGIYTVMSSLNTFMRSIVQGHKAEHRPNFEQSFDNETGKITVKKSVRKVGLNKDTIREGLAVFFDGNDQQAETALKVIVDSLPTKETSTISVTGLKKKTSE